MPDLAHAAGHRPHAHFPRPSVQKWAHKSKGPAALRALVALVAGTGFEPDLNLPRSGCDANYVQPLYRQINDPQRLSISFKAQPRLTRATASIAKAQFARDLGFDPHTAEVE